MANASRSGMPAATFSAIGSVCDPFVATAVRPAIRRQLYAMYGFLKTSPSAPFFGTMATALSLICASRFGNEREETRYSAAS